MVVLGVGGIIVYSEMCGRVAAVSGTAGLRRSCASGSASRPAWSTLVARELVNLMTLAAEVGGVAIVLQLLSGLPVPPADRRSPSSALALVVWMMPFEWIERLFGYGGLLPARLRRRGGQAGPGLGRGRRTASCRTSHRATTLALRSTSPSACSAPR